MPSLGSAFLSIDGRTVFSNRAWHQILGYTADELSNFLINGSTSFHPDDRASGAERYAKLIDGRRGDGRNVNDALHSPRDGRLVVCNSRFQLLRDATGNPQYVVALTCGGHLPSASGSRRNETAWRSKWRCCWNLPVRAFTVSICKDTALSLTALHVSWIDYSPEEVLGQRMHDLIHHHKPDGSVYPIDECPLYGAFKNGESCYIDSEVTWRRDGTPVQVEYSSFPILEDGAITGADRYGRRYHGAQARRGKAAGRASSYSVQFSRTPRLGSLISRSIARNIAPTGHSRRCWATAEKSWVASGNGMRL